MTSRITKNVKNANTIMLKLYIERKSTEKVYTLCGYSLFYFLKNCWCLNSLTQYSCQTDNQSISFYDPVTYFSNSLLACNLETWSTIYVLLLLKPFKLCWKKNGEKNYDIQVIRCRLFIQNRERNLNPGTICIKVTSEWDWERKYWKAVR